MKTEFEIKMAPGDMYRFLMYHAYHSFSGIFSIIAGLILLVLFFVNKGNNTPNGWIYLLFGVLFLAYQPWTLYTSSVKQVKLNPTFKKPLRYIVSDESIAVRQGEDAGQVSWEDVRKVRESAKNILVYTGKKNACIWVKSQLGQNETEVRELLKKHVSPEKIKLKK